MLQKNQFIRCLLLYYFKVIKNKSYRDLADKTIDTDKILYKNKTSIIYKKT